MRVIIWRRSRLSDCCLRQLKVLPFIALFVILVLPVRNALFSFVLPGMWTEHNSLFLFKVLWDHQILPVEMIPLGQSPIKLKINMNDIQMKFTSQQETFLAYQKRTTLLRELALSDSEAKIELEELLKFEPPMSEHDRAIAMFTLDVFVNACEAANLTYFLISGSALGALRHHGMIPWDDDIDVIMNSAQWEKIRNVLANVEGFGLYSQSRVQWKFFMKSLPQGNKPFKWPNIDIFFFNQDDTHVWAQTWGAKASLCSKKSDIFPLRRRKFERWNLPVPRQVELLVAAEFGNYHSACKSLYYNHKSNFRLPGTALTTVDCKKLHNVFPFVFRQRNNQGITIEVRKVAGQSLGNITVPAEV